MVIWSLLFHMPGFVAGIIFSLVIGLATMVAYVWLTSYAPSTGFLESEEEETQLRDRLRREWESTTDLHHQEAYRCGWAYIAIVHTERPGIDLRILSRMKGKQQSNVPGVYFAVLKHDTIFLYDNEEQSVCNHMIFLRDVGVDLVPHTLLLDEIYINFHPIRIMHKASNGEGDKEGKRGKLWQGQDVIFFYAASAMEKEDWFLSLRMAIRPLPERTVSQSQRLTEAIFMERLGRHVKGPHVDSSSQWLNAIIGRIFFNLFQSGDLERLFRIKFERKTATAPKPFFIGSINLESISVGPSLPLLSKGQLHSVGTDGEMVGSVEVFYPGGFKLRVSSDLKLEIPRLKPLVVPVAMSVQIRRFSGKAMIRIKAPPTDRLWIGFYSQPYLDIDVEPIVSTAAITWTVIKTALLRHLNQEIAENLVLPNMDDITIPPLVIGGLFGGEKPFDLDSLPPSVMDEAKQLDLTAHGISSMAGTLQNHVISDTFNVEPSTMATSPVTASSPSLLSTSSRHEMMQATPNISATDIAMKPVESVVSSSTPTATTQRSVPLVSPALLDGARQSDLLARERQRNLTSPETISGSSSSIFSPPTPATSISMVNERRNSRGMFYSLRRSVSSLIGMRPLEGETVAEFQDEIEVIEKDIIHLE